MAHQSSAPMEADLPFLAERGHEHLAIQEGGMASGQHKMQVSEHLTRPPSKHVLADRLKIYSRLLEREENAR